jgi:hypothetical protein
MIKGCGIGHKNFKTARHEQFKVLEKKKAKEM